MDIRGTGFVTQRHLEISIYAKLKGSGWIDPVWNPSTTVASGHVFRSRTQLLQDTFAGTGAKQGSGLHYLAIQYQKLQT